MLLVAFAPDGTTVHFENCLVRSTQRRSGIAASLVQTAEEHYREEGFAAVQFPVRHDLEAYDALLRSGYEVIRIYFKDKPTWDGGTIVGQERHLLRKKLQSADYPG